MSSRKIAIAGSIAALASAATPVAAVAATTHHGSAAKRVDNSRDMRGVRDVDRTPDNGTVDRSADRSSDTRDR